MKRNFLFRAMCAMVACAGIIACEKDNGSNEQTGNGGDDDGGSSATYTLIASPTSIDFGWNATAPQTITVTTNAPGGFTIGETPGWYTATASGATITVTPTENTGDARNHQLVISAEGANSVTITVSQDKKGEIHPSLQGEKYIVWQLDATSTSYLGDKIILSLAENTFNTHFYIWPNGDSFIADNTASGANFYGNMDGYMALIIGNVGWTGAGYTYSAPEGGEDEMTPIFDEIVANSQGWYFHAAVKGTYGAGSKFAFQEKAGASPWSVSWDSYGVNETDWKEIEIPMSEIISAGWTGFPLDSNNLICQSGTKAGDKYHYDAVFIYKK